MLDTQAENPRAVVGDNNPPSPINLDEIAGQMAANHRDLLDRRDDLLAGVSRAKERHPEIQDDDTAGSFADFMRQINAAIKVAKDRHGEAKRPYLEAGRLVDSFFKDIIEKLDSGKTELSRVLTAFQLRKEEEARKRAEEARKRAEEDARRAREEADRLRREREEADRLRREAEEAAERAETAKDIAEAARKAAQAQQAAEAVNSAESAAELDAHAAAAEGAAVAAATVETAKAADLSRTRGTYGAVASLKTKVDFEVEDINAIPREYLMVHEPTVRAAIKRGVRVIPGLRIFEKKIAAVR